MTFTFYVPRTNAGGGNVLDPTTGDDRSSDNQARSVAQWTTDRLPRPLTSVSVDSPTPEHTLFDKSIAIQKSSSLVNDVGATGPSPGDTIAYQLSFQISDYFSFGDLIVTDVFSDGQRLAAGFTPTFSITDRTGTVAGSFTQSGGTPDLIVDLSEIGNDTNPATDGSTRLVFDVSQALLQCRRRRWRPAGRSQRRSRCRPGDRHASPSVQPFRNTSPTRICPTHPMCPKVTTCTTASRSTGRSAITKT